MRSACVSNLPVTICQNNQNIYQGDCFSICPPGTYILESNCVSCSSNCIQCSNLLCDICDIGYFIDNNRACQLSTVTCPSNQNIFQNTCVTNCPNGTYLSDKFCSFRCKYGYYYNSQYNECFSNCRYPTTINEYACIWNRLLIKILIYTINLFY